MATVGTFAIFGAAVWLASKTLDRFYPEPDDIYAPVREPGCLLFGAVVLGYLLILGLLFYPAIDALKRHSCRGAEDFELCVEGDNVGGNDWM